MSHENKRPLALIILDGWGVSAKREGNAIALAHTPCYDEICEYYPSTMLAASGPRVGLSADTPGNSEIGHRTIGAGRVVQTDASKIARAIASGEFLQNEVLRSAFSRAVQNGSAVHFVGLLGDGGIHSTQETLFALLRMAKINGVTDAFVHGILDGRDVQPRTADIYVDALEIKMSDIRLGKVASLCGRFYAMDSGENWERTARAYTMLVHGEGEHALDAVTAIRASFLRGISDEFVSPIVIEKSQDEPLATIKDNDLVIFFNHTGEAMRQLVRSLAVPDAAASKPKTDFVCLTEYDPAFGLPVAFGQNPGENLLTDVFEQQGIVNYRITESSRSPHVSTFFNGRTGQPAGHEERVIIPADGVELLESAPESRSFKITDSVLRSIENNRTGVFVVNFPAPGLLSESGNLNRTIESIQYVDTCLGGIVDKMCEMDGVTVVTASHPGCEQMGGTPVYGDVMARISNPVPLHYIDPANMGTGLASGGSLADVAPTILGILGIDKPSEMSGRDLRLVS